VRCQSRSRLPPSRGPPLCAQHAALVVFFRHQSMAPIPRPLAAQVPNWFADAKMPPVFARNLLSGLRGGQTISHRNLACPSWLFECGEASASMTEFHLTASNPNRLSVQIGPHPAPPKLGGGGAVPANRARAVGAAKTISAAKTGNVLRQFRVNVREPQTLRAGGVVGGPRRGLPKFPRSGPASR